MMFDVTGLGSVAIDFIGTIHKWPVPGTKNGFEDFDVYDGGLTGTALTAVSRLGGKASYIGKMGISEMAGRAVMALDKEGIDLSNLIRDVITEPIITIIITSVKTGERNIFFKKENLNFPMTDELPDPYWYKKTKVFFTDHVAREAGIKAARIAKEQGLPVVVDIERVQDGIVELMQYSTHIIVSHAFAQQYSGSQNPASQLKALRRNPEQVIIITRGEEGCLIWAGNEQKKVPSYPVNPVDTTGCGDTFHGTYALCIARGMDPFSAALRSNAAAAMCATEIGARTGIPYKNQLEAFIEIHKGK